MCADDSSLDGSVYTSSGMQASAGASQWEIVPCGDYVRIKSVAKDAWLHASGDEFRIGNPSWDNPHRRQVLTWATGAEPLQERDDDASKWEFVASDDSEIVRIKNVKNSGWMYPNAPEYGGVLTYVGAEFPQDRAYTEWQIALSVEHLQQAVSRFSRESEQLNQENAKQQQEIERLSREIEGLKEDKSGQEQFFENLFGREKAALQQTIEKLHRESAAQQEEIEKLKLEKAEQQEEMEILQREREGHQQEVANLRRENEEQEQLMESLMENMVKKVASTPTSSSSRKSSKRK